MNDTAKNESAGHEEKEHEQEEIVGSEFSPGAQLSARRQALNWSIEQVANQLNLAPRQILAIETDNYAALPGMASVRGFIRSYAKLLNVDAAPLLEAIAKEAPSTESVMPLRRELTEVRFAESRLSSSGNRPSMARIASIVLLLFALVAGGIYVMQQMGMQSLLPIPFQQLGMVSSPIITSPVGSAETVVDEPSTTLGDAHPDSEKNVIDATLDSAGSDNAKNPATVVTDAAVNAVNGIVTAGSTAVPSVHNSDTDTKNKLTLKLREDSWVEIKRPDNSTLVSALFKADTTESFKITGPVSMTIGNAAGVDVILRGKTVELKAGTKSNVARLTLK